MAETFIAGPCAHPTWSPTGYAGKTNLGVDVIEKKCGHCPKTAWFYDANHQQYFGKVYEIYTIDR